MSRMCFNCMQMTEDGDFCAYCGKKLKAAPAHHLLPGTVLNGKYTVGYALGEGGFGVTYIGLDNSLQIKVAIKEFFPNMPDPQKGDLSVPGILPRFRLPNTPSQYRQYYLPRNIHEHLRCRVP